MWLELLALGLWSGVVSMDTTAVMQVMISRPLVSCLITGAILGDYQLGLIIGIYLELLWINELPIGAAKFLEGNVGATAAAAIAVYSFQNSLRIVPSIVFSLLLALAISHLGGYLVKKMRYVNGDAFDKLLVDPNISAAKVEKLHFKGILYSFLIGIVIIPVFAVVLGWFALPLLISWLPVSVDQFLEPVNAAFLGVGSAILMFMFTRHKQWWMIFIGFCAGLLYLLIK